MPRPKARCVAGRTACANPGSSENVGGGRAFLLLRKQLLSGRHPSGMVQEQAKNLERLFLQLYPNAALAELGRPKVQLENPKAASLAATLRGLHRRTPLV